MKVSKRTRVRRKLVKTLDERARNEVFERDGWHCARCGSTKNLQWAHVYSRRHKHLRWVPENSMVLCAGCHIWWHDVPIESGTWFKNKYLRRYELISDARFRGNSKVTVKDMEAML